MIPRIHSYHTIFVLGVLILGLCFGKEDEGRLRTSGKQRRRANTPPSYAVPMEPLVQYSQRDPLYHKRSQSSHSRLPDQSDVQESFERSNHSEASEQAVASDRFEVNSYYPSPYYTHPEPIIEIIIKESNVTLPTLPPPPPRPTTKEPVHVFYVKYKKNPNPKGKNDQILYDPPIPALVPHSSEIHEHEDSHYEAADTVSTALPPTTTLRTIIRPESETYHGSSIKVTFGNPEETELEEGTEQRPRVVPPPGSHHFREGALPNFQQDLYHQEGHFFPQAHHHQGGGPQAPTQIFNSHHQTHLNPPNAPNLGPVQESSFQNSKYAPPTDEQVRQYQQEKIYLYQQSLKQQNVQLPPSISPINHPQQFQQPTSNPPSQLQINFNTQKQQLHQQPTLHPHHQQQFKQSGQSFQHNKQTQFQSKRPYSNNFQPDQYNNNQNVHTATQQQIHNRNRRPESPADSNRNKNIYNVNYENNSPQPLHQQINRPSVIPGLDDKIQPDSIQKGIGVFEQTIISDDSQNRQYHTRHTPNSHAQQFNHQESNYKPNYQDGDIVKSVSHSEEHQLTPDYRNELYSSLRELPKRNKLPESEDPLQFYPVYTTPNPTNQNQYLSRVSSVRQPQAISTPFVSTTEKNSERSGEFERINESTTVKPENKTALKANIAALPDEVPADLRAQLLSSGILGNADIQILDYDKVGDIPIESLPPEALENFYSAGSDPVPSVVKPDTDQVDMKVKRFNPNPEKGQKVVKSYYKKYATQLEPVIVKDSKYNRYLPLKVNGTEFPLPDNPQLKGRTINSVVVLAPVDYDFVKEKDKGEERAGRAIQVEGVRFIAGEALKDLVKNPIKENYRKWLEQERNTPSKYQSVVLLITRRDERDRNGPELFMFDVNTSSLSKLRGELSQTFVQVAESNSSSQDLEGLDTAN